MLDKPQISSTITKKRTEKKQGREKNRLLAKRSKDQDAAQAHQDKEAGPLECITENRGDW